MHVFVRQAEILLGEAVLDALYQAYRAGKTEGMTPKEISENIGAYRKKNDPTGTGKNDGLVSGILNKLLDEARVTHQEKRWQISATEIAARDQHGES